MVVVEMTSKSPLLPIFGRRDFFFFVMTETITYDKPFKTYSEMIDVFKIS